MPRLCDYFSDPRQGMHSGTALAQAEGGTPISTYRFRDLARNWSFHLRNGRMPREIPPWMAESGTIRHGCRRFRPVQFSTTFPIPLVKSNFEHDLKQYVLTGVPPSAWANAVPECIPWRRYPLNHTIACSDFAVCRTTFTYLSISFSSISLSYPGSLIFPSWSTGRLIPVSHFEL